MKKGVDHIGVSVGALIFNEQGELLLCKRSQLARNEKGSWEAPGGGVDFGETREIAVKREMKEELGVDIEILEVLHVSDELLEKDKQHWVPTTYIAKVANGQTPKIMEPDKCDAIGWFALDQLPEPLSMITQMDVAAYKKKKRVQQPVEVCLIVLSKDQEKVLLGKRRNSFGAGFLGLPGGKVNVTESLVDCGKRELLEETGLITSALMYVGVVRELQGDYHFTHFIFVCKKYTGEVKTMEPEKNEERKWYSLSELPEPILRGHQAGLEMFTKPNSEKYKDIFE